MARWMVLYPDYDGEGKCAVIDDKNDCNMPYGSLAADAINDLPDINTSGTIFVIELSDEPANDPMVISGDSEVGRQFVDIGG